jgi:hypothetical protein
MADIIDLINSKKSRAEYFREYRRRQMVKTQNPIPNLALKAHKRSLDEPKSLMVYVASLAILSAATTAYLVYLSAAFFEGSFLFRLGLSILSETLLLALVLIKTQSKLENVFRLVLLTTFCCYSVLPFIFEPVKNENKSQSSLNLIHLNQESLKREIEKLTLQHNELVALQRITRSDSVAQQIATFETQLRNSYEHETEHQLKSYKALPAWLLSLQRLLFVAVNIFLVHHLSYHFTFKVARPRRRKHELQATRFCEVGNVASI